MPHIRFRGIQSETVKAISKRAVDLAQIIETTPDNFTFEHVNTQFFDSGSFVSGTPFVEVLWFSRSQHIKQLVANYLTDVIQEFEQYDYVSVVFIDLNPSSYFENKKHF